MVIVEQPKTVKQEVVIVIVEQPKKYVKFFSNVDENQARLSLLKLLFLAIS